MAMNAMIRGHELDNQPARYRITPVDAQVDYAADGTPIATVRNGPAGTVVEWIWGDVVPPETVDEVFAAWSLSTSIAFKDKGDNWHTYQAVWLAPPTLESGGGRIYREMTARFVVVSGSVVPS